MGWRAGEEIFSALLCSIKLLCKLLLLCRLKTARHENFVCSFPEVCDGSAVGKASSEAGSYFKWNAFCICVYIAGIGSLISWFSKFTIFVWFLYIIHVATFLPRHGITIFLKSFIVYFFRHPIWLATQFA